ncbi:MAG: type II secretion system F family protein [Desulfobacterales bacterium]|nr:type II secretion system F family protein [Desulfobacterales bacterium]
MTIFSWKGVDTEGRPLAGDIDAQNLNKARIEIYERGARPDEIKVKKRSFFKRDLFQRKISTVDILNFTRQLETMINSGLPIVRCLSTIKEQEQKPKLKEVITKIQSSVESGSYLSEAISEFPEVFSSLYIHMVKAGEKGGILGKIMSRLADTIEKENDLRKNVKDALVYPAFILSVAITVITIIIGFVIPVFKDMFISFGSDLPLPTQFVVDLSLILKNNSIYILLVLISLTFLLKTLYSSEKGRLRIDALILKVPVIGSIILKKSISSFSRSMGSMMESKVTINEALYLSSKTAENRFFAKIVAEINVGISEGVTLTDAFKQTSIFPPVAVSMIATGDATGSLEKMFKRLADLLDNETQRVSKNMVKLLEPVVIVITGVIVAALIISIYLPVFYLPGTMGL